ncbi:ABC transporter ATP-binding protein [Marinovum sp.]|uniref:energy-coupling factor ABC transporter ATP-binding protein n=1 Tax=Marinovum sp. TaxID=2024839 RepID=UPI002B274933|nr:ABC transporter ATP-binding protein [Marinovum sp.]
MIAQHMTQSGQTAPAKARPASGLLLETARFAHGEKVVLADLTLDLAVTRLAVVGRNGSGKSTLARLLAGLVAPQQGQVRINGIDVARDRKAALCEVGILFQNPDHQIIFPTVLEELAFGLGQQGRSKRAAETEARAVLARFGKAHWQEAYVNTLSHGQKHLVCLMAITAMAPRLLILDEPFAGLDIPTRAQLTRYLSHYTGNLIHISHDPADLTGYDQALWLERGRIAALGESDQVIAEYVARMTELGEADDIADLAG